MSKKPVVFLAFANDRIDDAAYLRNLPREMDGIRTALERAKQAGLCEIVERSNATIQQIIGIFQSAEYQGRIAIFHYGGHANGYQLLLENLSGEHASAHSEGLVSFFSKQLGLKLIFLNGCSSQQQALDLINAGIPAVVGTSQAINDDIATALAIRFYSGLGEGQAIEKAWEEAVDEIKIEKGTANTRDLYWEGATETVSTSDRFPWEIHFREGAEIIRNWNMPEAVDNPLFGLPAIPPNYHLPEAPYLYLQRYQRPQAEIFFGRSYYIRTLYNLVTNPKSPSLILLYGQSGVGKSSLIDAGFKPRLEHTHHIWYLRRDQGISIPTLFEKAAALKEGIMNKMASELGAPSIASPQQTDEETSKINAFYTKLEKLSVEHNDALPEEMRELFYRLTIEMRASKDFYLLKKKKGARQNRSKPLELIDNSEMNLLDQWILLETITGKPLIVIVDQLESVFTIPDPNLPNEFEEFVADIQLLFSNPERLPQGKLILSYRKEYHPEIEDRFKEVQMPRSRVFLKHLSRKDIEDVVTGLTRSERTRQHYGLQVEENLPTIIADDLLEDKESPIAPVLQILLTKMWQLTEEDDAGGRLFTIDKYQQLRQDGILMDDFYIQQMKVLKEWNSEVVTSGLALDIMMFHSSALMTADIRKKDELYREYAENLDVLESLIEKLMELYLLSGIQVDREVRTTLAHDTLAPIVFQQYRSSDYPGQRARRILENKISSYNPEDPSTGLDLADLAIVEYGHYGMRAWTPEEEALVASGIERRNRHFKAKERRRKVGILVTILIAFLGLFAGVEALRARREKQKAEEQRQLAEKHEEEAKNSENIAQQAKKQAEKDAEAAKKARLEALESQEEAITAKNQAEAEAAKARRAELLAAEQAIKAQKAETEANENFSFAQKQEALAKSNEALAKKGKKTADSLNNLAQTRALALKASSVRNVKHEAEVSGILALQAYNDIQQFGGNKQDKDVFQALATAWDLLSPVPSTVDAQQGDIEHLMVTKDKKSLLVAGTNGSIKFWDIANVLSYSKSLSFCQDEKCYIRDIDISPSGQNVVSFHTDNKIRFWDLAKDHKDEKGNKGYVIKKNILLDMHENKLVGGAFFSDDDFVSIDISGDIYYWNIAKGGTIPIESRKTGIYITAIAQHPTEPFILLATIDNSIKILDIVKKTVADWLPKNKLSSIINCMEISPDGQLLAIGGQNGALSLLNYREQGYSSENGPSVFHIKTWQPHLSAITDLSFDYRGKMLGSSGYDQTVKVYTVNEIKKPYTEPSPIINIQENTWIKAVSFMPDGEHVVSGGFSGYIHIYNTNLEILANNIHQELKKRLNDQSKIAEIKDDLQSIIKERDDYDHMINSILNKENP